MTKEYPLKILVLLLWIGIFLLVSLFLTHKVLATHGPVCTFDNYHPPVVPDPSYCTSYFPDTIAFPPCNTERTCANKAFNRNRCDFTNPSNVDGTTCCTQGLGRDFCDQKDLGAGVIAQYEFRCCNIPPTPTPTP